MYVLRRWSVFLDGEEPNLKTADAFLASLAAQGRANSSLSTIPVLRKYLKWKDPEVETKELYDKYGREYRRAHGYDDYLRKWRALKMMQVQNGKKVWIPIPYRRSKPEKCEVCSKVTRRLLYHHWNNNDLSKGLWVCDQCHRIAEGVEAVSRHVDTMKSYLDMKSIAEQDFQYGRTG